jgi:GT2 family glycosyltransferase
MTVAVIVPVLARPHRAQPLVDSLRATTDCRMLFVCSPTDTDQINACRQTGEETLVVDWDPGRADFAKKVNEAYRHTTEDWVFCGADDLRFTPGWLEAAIKIGEQADAGVVGTQDLGNPEVKRGRHSTHPLVARTYIETQGGTFDQTGEIYCELYSHQFVDTELVHVAKARGRWQFAKTSVVEHNHPHWGKSEMDATYDKAVADTKADRALFSQRIRRFQALETRRVRAQ